MKYLYIMMLTTIVKLAFAGDKTELGLEKISDFGDNPGNLEMYVYVPGSVSENASLVVVMHGCLQRADTIAEQSGWNKLADENAFIVVYPQQKASNNIGFCFNWFKKGDQERDQGEAASIKQMIYHTLENYSIDKSRIFVTGLSGGGAMASVMLANYPELFNSGAIMSGIAFGAASTEEEGRAAMKGNVTKSGEEWAGLVKKQNPEYTGPYPNIVVFQGMDDPYVTKINADEIVKQYKSLHHIEANADIVKKFDDNENIELHTYRNNTTQEIVSVFYLHNFGHAIAIDPGEGSKKGGKTAKFAVDNNFHSPYWAAKFFEIIIEK